MLMTWSDVWAVVLTGLIVVFTGLLLLVFFVWLFGKIVGAISKKPPQNKGGDSQSGVPQKTAQTAPVSPPQTGGISGDVIAAITAAVTAFAGEGAVIRSVKRAQPKSGSKSFAKSLEWNRPRFSGAEVIENGRWSR
ncbi:MAG: OadG family protein [Ruminococcus sp.]|jgi:sodium pump decarboxylase gamma subunit|nr:OadG family protein [Ruminococcus sp.]